MTPLETLRALGTGSEAPADAKQRVHSALLASLEGAAAAAAAGAAALHPPPTSLPPAPLGVVAGAAGSKTVAIAVGIWLLGGATGAALYGALRPPQVHVVYVDRPALARPPAAPPQEPANTTKEPAKAAEIAGLSAGLPRLAAPLNAGLSHGAGAPSAAASAAGPSSELARERALLDLARASAAQGEPGQVLERVAEHTAQFPHGHLTEEREALAIRALLALGRESEARERAQAFRSAYPNSFLTPVIDSALSAP